MLTRAMDLDLVRTYADEVAWLAARLNRRTAEMECLHPDSKDFRDAVLVADALVREISVALQKLRSNTP